MKHISGQNVSGSIGSWQTCSPASAAPFSAVAYFFGLELYKKLGVPIGLINCSWGCTHIEEWIDKRLIENDPAAVQSAIANTDCHLGGLGNLYDGMVAPIVPYRMAGFIWYQGESNRFKPDNYQTLLETMIVDWRSVFGKKLPFYFVQIAPFNYPQKAYIIREMQASVKLPHTGMVVISDLVDNLNEIHPTNKLDVGKRLANMALAETYGLKMGAYKSPMYKSMKVDRNKARISFENAGKALVCRGQNVLHCRVAGTDRKFVDAEAQVDGNTLLVGNDAIKNPVAVRFCFDNNSTPNVFSSEGLPVAPFRTDDWPLK
jgi:sialate O-acetylesterase